MDDLTAKVQQILGSEDGMRQLQEMAKMLGLSGDGSGSGGGESGAAAPGGLDLGSLLSGQQEDPPPISPADLMRIGGMMQNMKQDTPGTTLLKALRPLLREERQKKVDQAVRMMRLFSLLPILQESGLLKGLLGGDGS